MPKQQASVLRYCSSLQILLFYMYYTDQEAEKAILVGVALQSEGITYEQMTEYLDELSFLAETAGAETVKIFTQNLDKPVHATFIGKGKLENSCSTPSILIVVIAKPSNDFAGIFGGP